MQGSGLSLAHPQVSHLATSEGAVVASNDGIGHVEDDVVRIGPSGPLHSESNVGNGQTIVSGTDLQRHQAAGEN